MGWGGGSGQLCGPPCMTGRMISEKRRQTRSRREENQGSVMAQKPASRRGGRDQVDEDRQSSTGLLTCANGNLSKSCLGKVREAESRADSSFRKFS